jgi:hypothetical protein
MMMEAMMSDDSDDNGLMYGYRSPIRCCHRIAPRHCPVGSLSTQKATSTRPRALHVDPAQALHSESRSRHAGVPQFDILFACLELALLAYRTCLFVSCNTLAPLSLGTFAGNHH